MDLGESGTEKKHDDWRGYNPEKAASFLATYKKFAHEENHRLLCMAKRYPGEI
jgi:hypothetical protein